MSVLTAVATTVTNPEAEALLALQAAGLLDDETVARIRRVWAHGGIALVDAITQLGLLPERDLAHHLAGLLNLGLATPDRFPAAPVLSEVLSPWFLREQRMVPLAVDGQGVRVAAVNPFDALGVQGIRLATGRPVILDIATASDIEAAFVRLYPLPAAEGEGTDTVELDLAQLRERASDAPVIRFVDNFIARAVAARASDIHLQPLDRRFRVRMRVDGVWAEVDAVSLDLAPAVISRLKILAGLDIAERRLPQDGGIKTVVRGREVDLRVAVMPTIAGEAAVIRVLDREQVALDIGALGFEGRVRDRLIRLFERPNGTILVTGPTGSGKSTTLYAALTHLNQADRNIITVEDPVENKIEGVSQIQVKPEIGLTFARVLRSILRYAPNVIMVGEIRDPETAQIATQASLTGHLVLATLHTNSAAAAVTRLLDMGVENYLIASTVTGVLAQRLVRVLCPACKVRGESGWQPAGCEACGHSGYRGRIAIHELLPVTEAVRRAVVSRATAGDIHAIARAEGMETLHECGLRLAAAGITSRAEVERIAIEDQE